MNSNLCERNANVISSSIQRTITFEVYIKIQSRKVNPASVGK